MKLIFLLIAACFAFALADKKVDLTSDSLNQEIWIEAEKTETIRICLNRRVQTWETSLKTVILNDSCVAFQAPTLIGVESINVYFPDADSSKKINLAVGMKYLNFKNENILLGFNENLDGEEEDPERFVSVTGTYLVDKYPVTNCEFTQLMWDSIPEKATYEYWDFQKHHKKWLSRKKHSMRNENCIAHDTAANMLSVQQAMKYANARSIKEGLKPYYHFSKIDADGPAILADGYIITYWDFKDYGTRFFDGDEYFYPNPYIKVTEDKTSDGYRLPYYDEWMMFARGGDTKKKAPWGDTTATFEEALKYAKFSDFTQNKNNYEDTEPVGQLLPNGYGLYDMIGLVQENVLLKKLLRYNFSNISCMKGGGYRIVLDPSKSQSIRYWKRFNYGYYQTGSSLLAGFRLIRNIGNNAKWSEIKTVDNE
jgi:formylglycine-generating enzyme required for sulfatase activity